MLLGVGVVAWLMSEKQELPRTESQPTLYVNAIRVERSEAFPTATGFGTAQALRTWTAIAEVGGRIQETHTVLRDGIAVAADQLLLNIDTEDYELRLKQRQAEVTQTRSQLEQVNLQAKADALALELQRKLLKVRENELARIEKLRDGIASSAAELDTAQASLLLQAQSVQNLESSLATYSAQIASAEASLSIAKSNMRSAERDLARTQLRAPFRGVLTGVALEEAQYVAPNQQLFQVIDNSSVEITAQFSLAQLLNLVSIPTRSDSRATQELAKEYLVSGARTNLQAVTPDVMEHWLERLAASVVVRSGDVEVSFPARVARATGTVDEQTRTLGIVVQVENLETHTPSALSPGTYCEVVLQASRPTLAHIVPRDSLNGDTVLVVDENNQLLRREVKHAFSWEGTVALSEGLNDGELLVLNPSASMRAGKLVQVHLLNHGSPAGSVAGNITPENCAEQRAATESEKGETDD